MTRIGLAPRPPPPSTSRWKRARTEISSRADDVHRRLPSDPAREHVREPSILGRLAPTERRTPKCAPAETHRGPKDTALPRASVVTAGRSRESGFAPRADTRGLRPCFRRRPAKGNDFHETGCLPLPGAPLGRRFWRCPTGAASPSDLRHHERLLPPISFDRTHVAWRPSDQRDHAFITVPSVCAPTGPTLELGSEERDVGVETPIVTPSAAPQQLLRPRKLTDTAAVTPLP